MSSPASPQFRGPTTQSLQQLLSDLALPLSMSSIGNSVGPLTGGVVGTGSSHGTSASAVVYRVVLTGGPCGGKTTAASTITERFQALGWRVFRVPEAATMLLSGGHTFANLNKLQQYIFQGALLKLMLSLEDAFITLARSTHQKCIVLMDRGTMDCRSYMPEDEWELLLKELGLTTLQLRDGRYDAVLHLVTAADGADKFYTIEGHAARSETPAYARELDARIKNNWVGHPYFHVIDNSTDFQGKISRLMSTICNFVGMTSLSGTMQKRKFLIKPGSNIVFPENIKTESFEVDHDYILRTDSTHQGRLRRRGKDNVYTYGYTLRYPDLHGQRLELKRLLSKREYADMLISRDPNRVTLTKNRTSFLYNDQYYELDVFLSPHKGLTLLEFYAPKDRDASTLLPDFLDVAEEVTGNPAWSMYRLSLIGAECPVPVKTRSRPSSMDAINAPSSSSKDGNATIFQTLANSNSSVSPLNRHASIHVLSNAKYSSAPSSPMIQPSKTPAVNIPQP